MDNADPPRFPQLVVHVSEAEADEVGYLLCELGAAGVELRDQTTMSRSERAGWVDLVASFATTEQAAGVRDTLHGSHPKLATEVGELVGDSWRERYKEHFRPFALTPAITVVPSWHTESVEGTILWMDPGRAFGTGLHATTALVAAQLEKRRESLSAGALLDVGSGSGVLALCALLLGCERAVAIDNDPEVIDVIAENALANRMAERIEISTTPIEDVEGSFPMVVANIRAGALMKMASHLANRMSAGGLLILSGVLQSEHDEVVSHFLALGSLSHCETTERGEHSDRWVAIVLQRV